MTQQLQHFLLVFDHEAGRLIEQVPFGPDGTAAVAAYAEKELQYRDQDRIEIVLIGSDSLDTIRLTHPNYFGGSFPASKYLQGIL